MKIYKSVHFSLFKLASIGEGELQVADNSFSSMTKHAESSNFNLKMINHINNKILKFSHRCCICLYLEVYFFGGISYGLFHFDRRKLHRYVIELPLCYL